MRLQSFLMLAVATLSSCEIYEKTRVTITCKAGWPSEGAKRSVNPSRIDRRSSTAGTSAVSASNTTLNASGVLALRCEDLDRGSRSYEICLAAREVISFEIMKEWMLTVTS